MRGNNEQSDLGSPTSPDAKLGTGIQPKAETQLKEQLAAIEHERWADWQRYCHKVLRESGSPAYLEPILDRWDEQIEKTYDQLNEREKAADMEQVDRYWPLIQEYIKAREALPNNNAPQSAESPAAIPSPGVDKGSKLATCTNCGDYLNATKFCPGCGAFTAALLPQPEPTSAEGDDAKDLEPFNFEDDYRAE